MRTGRSPSTSHIKTLLRGISPQAAATITPKMMGMLLPILSAMNHEGEASFHTFMAQGETLVKAGDFKQAYAFFTLAHASQRDRLEPHYRLGYACEMSDDLPKAEEHYDLAIKSTANQNSYTERAKFYQRRAADYKKKGETNKAQEYEKKFFQDLAEAKKCKQEESKNSVLQKAIEMEQDIQERWTELKRYSQILRQRQSKSEQKTLAIVPDDVLRKSAEATVLATYAGREGNDAVVSEKMIEAITLCEYNITALILRSLIFDHNNWLYPSLRELTNVIELDLDPAITPGAFCSLVSTYMKLANIEHAKAIEHQQHAKSAILRFMLYNRFSSFPNKEDCQSIIRSISAIEASHADSVPEKFSTESYEKIIARARTELNEKKYDAAITHFTHALLQHPANSSLCFERGKAYAALSRDKEAFEDYTRALWLRFSKTNSDKPPSTVTSECLQYRRDIYLKMDCLDDSLADQAKVLTVYLEEQFTKFDSTLQETALKNTDAKLRADAANIHLQLELIAKKANADFEKSQKSLTQLDFEMTPHFHVLREIKKMQLPRYFRKSLNKYILETYETLIKIKNDFCNKVINKAILLRDAKNYDSALHYFDKALEMVSDSAIAYFQRGMTYLCLHKQAEALADFKMAFDCDPSNQEIHSVYDNMRTQMKSSDTTTADVTTTRRRRNKPTRPSVRIQRQNPRHVDTSSEAALKEFREQCRREQLEEDERIKQAQQAEDLSLQEAKALKEQARIKRNKSIKENRKSNRPHAKDAKKSDLLSDQTLSNLVDDDSESDNEQTTSSAAITLSVPVASIAPVVSVTPVAPAPSTIPQTELSAAPPNNADKKTEKYQPACIKTIIPTIPEKNSIKFLKEAGADAYIVGGSVLERLLTEQLNLTSDIDLVTSAPPETILRVFTYSQVKQDEHDPRRFYFSWPLMLDNGIIIPVKIQIFRSTTLATSITDDADSRDFTLNAFYMDESGNVRSGTREGEQHLKDDYIHTIKPARHSFQEDPSRMLRALDLASKTNRMLAPDVKSAFEEKLPLLKNESPAKINSQILKFLSNNRAEKNFLRMLESNVITTLFPELATYLRLDKDWIVHELIKIKTRTHRAPSLHEIYAIFIASYLEQHTTNNERTTTDLIRGNDLLRENFAWPRSLNPLLIIAIENRKQFYPQSSVPALPSPAPAMPSMPYYVPYVLDNPFQYGMTVTNPFPFIAQTPVVTPLPYAGQPHTFLPAPMPNGQPALAAPVLNRVTRGFVSS